MGPCQELNPPQRQAEESREQQRGMGRRKRGEEESDREKERWRDVLSGESVSLGLGLFASTATTDITAMHRHRINLIHHMLEPSLRSSVPLLFSPTGS